MAVSRRINDKRSTLILGLLVALSVLSLASGARGGLITNGLRTGVQIVSMPFLLGFDRVEESLAYVYGLVVNYDKTYERQRAVERDLVDLNTRLAAHEELVAENVRLREMLAFQRERPNYRLVSANVIQHSRGILTIDQGSFHKVHESMCVLTPDGIVGLITRVGPFTANVATLQSPDCRVDAMIKRSRVRGQIQGGASELGALCAMQYIDLKDEVREGDAVVTSPDSVFPSGFPIGVVAGNPHRDGVAQSANILPAADPLRVDEVFILFNADRAWDEYAGQEVGFEAQYARGALEDTRTIQERYAP